MTNAAGEYFFGGGLQPHTAYVIRVINTSGPVAGRALSPANAGADHIDSDAVVVDGYPQIAVTTGPPGANNHTHDFGFLGPSDVIFRDGFDSGS